MYKRRCNEKSEKKEREKENISFPGIVSGIILWHVRINTM